MIAVLIVWIIIAIILFYYNWVDDGKPSFKSFWQSWIDNLPPPIGKESMKDKSDDKATKLLRQTARWSVASTQDKAPLVALLHANYGSAYLSALQSMYSDKEIEELSGMKLLELKKKVLAAQDNATRMVSEACPQFVGDMDHTLLRLAGNM